MNITLELDSNQYKDLTRYCGLNKFIPEEIAKKSYLEGFMIEKYGLLGNTGGVQEKEVIKEVVVEKRVEIPVEIIKEVVKVEYVEVPVEKVVTVEKPVEKLVEVIKEVPVEKIVEVTREVFNNSEIEKLKSENEKLRNELDKITSSLDKLGKGRMMKKSDLSNLYDE